MTPPDDRRYRFQGNHFAASITAGQTVVGLHELSVIVAKEYAQESQVMLLAADKGMRYTRLWFWVGLLLCGVGTGGMAVCTLNGSFQLVLSFALLAFPAAFMVVNSLVKRERIMEERKAGWALSVKAAQLAGGNPQVLQTTVEELIAKGALVAEQPGR